MVKSLAGVLDLCFLRVRSGMEGAEKMAQGLRALAALLREDLGSIPSTYKAVHNLL